MRKLLMFCIILSISTACTSIYIKNKTRHQGYAKGENISLSFISNNTKSPADSIKVVVIESKSGYIYNLWAARTGCDSICRYSVLWNGRKPSGEWPMGGRYNVFAFIENPKPAFSDTVEIGLGD